MSQIPNSNRSSKPKVFQIPTEDHPTPGMMARIPAGLQHGIGTFSWQKQYHY